MAQRELKELFTRSQKSSPSRSRSKSKVAQLIQKRREAEQERDEGIVGQMKRFEAARGSSSPRTTALKQLLKTASSPSKRSGERVLSHSRSQDDIPQLKADALADNLAAIKLQDFSKGYKAQEQLARQESLEDLNDREHYVPRRELSAARKARRAQERQRQQDQAQQLAEQQNQQQLEHLERASAYREILQQQIEEKRQKDQHQKDKEKEEEINVMK